MQALPDRPADDAAGIADDSSPASAAVTDDTLVPAGGARLSVVDGKATAEGGTQSGATTLKLVAERFRAKRLAAVLGLTAELLESPERSQAVLTLVNVLQHRVRSDRVVCALINDVHHDGADLHIAAISQQATLDTDTAEADLLLAAMREAAACGTAISWPKTGDALQIREAHRRLAGGRTGVQLHTVPMYHQEELVGVVLMERASEDAAWSPMVLELFDQLVATSAPLLALQTRADRSLVQHARSSATAALASLIGPRHVGIKVLSAVFLVALLGASVIPVTRQVVAPAEVSPAERRLVTAPLEGFIDSVFVRAGDTVDAGQKLVAFDTRDLELEAVRQDNEIASVQSDFRVAMAEHDRKQMAVTQAKLARVRAERKLTDRWLARTELRAPTAGIVVNDSLDNLVGAPVNRGVTLLEIAPETGHEVHLLIDEADVMHVDVGQQGLLALNANPGAALPFTVSAVHPIAEATDGHSRFRVTAELPEGAASLRPGQTGIGRLDTGRTTLLQRMTGKLSRWLKQRWWEWIG